VFNALWWRVLAAVPRGLLENAAELSGILPGELATTGPVGTASLLGQERDAAAARYQGALMGRET
jgi:hypothetical protein